MLNTLAKIYETVAGSSASDTHYSRATQNSLPLSSRGLGRFLLFSEQSPTRLSPTTAVVEIENDSSYRMDETVIIP
jgi:hypothetical protein